VCPATSLRFRCDVSVIVIGSVFEASPLGPRSPSSASPIPRESAATLFKESQPCCLTESQILWIVVV